MSSDFLESIEVIYQVASSTNSSTNRTFVKCVTAINHYKFYQFSLIPAFVITIAFAMLKKRRNMFLRLLGGRPGLVYPMDVLSRSSRISYAAAFGAILSLTYRIIFEQLFAIQFSGVLALKTLIAVASMFIYGIAYFPIFACLAAESAFGYGLSSLYVWMFTIVQFYKTFECNLHETTQILFVMRNLPHLVCLMYLSISMPVRFVLLLKGRKVFALSYDNLTHDEDLQSIRESYQGLHVVNLLKRREKKQLPVGICQKMKAIMATLSEKIIYRRKKGFRYSSRMLSVMILGGMLLYMLSVESLGFSVPFFDFLLDRIAIALDVIGWAPLDSESHKTASHRIYLLLTYYVIRATKYCFIVSVTLALALGLLMIAHALSSYRTNLHALYKGDHTHIPPASERSNASLMVGFIRYAGYQVAYIAWGFVIQWVVFFLLAFAAAIAITFIRLGIYQWLINLLKSVWPVIMWAIILNLGQFLMAKFLFLQGRGSALAIDNRRFLFCFTFFMFFFNIFLGAVSCLMRIIKAIGIGALFLPRLDNSTLPRRFQFLDPGFAAYVGFMHVEASHTHPVMIVFIRLMMMILKTALKPRIKTDVEGQNGIQLGVKIKPATDIDYEKRRKSYAARFNWHVAYTLLNNPSVRLFRKGYLQSLMKAMEEGKRIPVTDGPTIDPALLKEDEEKEVKEPAV